MFSHWKPENRALLDEVVYQVLSQPLYPKQESDQFCGVFVDGRDRSIENIYEFAAFKAFKVNSQYNYPIFAFINKNYIGDFLTPKIIKEFRITVVPIEPIICKKSLKNYTEFMVKKLPFLIPEKFKQCVFFQADGFLANSGIEDYIEHNNPYYLGARWGHYTAIDTEDEELNEKIKKLFTCIGNGGFSYRRMDIMREISEKYSNIKQWERMSKKKNFPPEDLFFGFWTYFTYQNKILPLDIFDLFSQDPLKKIEDLNHTYGFHSINCEV